MDTSEEYVKMCRAAKEIQDSHEWECGDYFYECPYDDGYGSVSWKIRTIGSDNKDAMVPADVWLPRQDQLQDMCTSLNKFKPIYSLAYVTMWAEASGFDCGANDYAESLNSLEQVWLAYVMDENYYKKWNGEEWL